MQPCAVCGGVQVNAAGYCTQCGTFRGIPQQPPPPPPAYPQAPPPGYPGYPQPGSPPAYPTSVPPAGYPTSVPPAYAQQTSGGGYPGYPPQPQQQRGRSYMVPLFALGSVLVALVVAIVIVVAARGGGDDPIAGPTGDPTTGGPVESTSAAPGSDLDECVIGTWRVTSHKETVAVQGDSVTFTGGEGATLRLNRDGTGETDYGSSTEYSGELNGSTVRLEISGRLTYNFTTRAGRVNVTDVESNVSGKVTLGGEEYDVPNVLDTKDDSSSYTCSTDRLTQNTGLLTTEYERVS
ncbi:hypothetical protein ACTMTJ_10800 [Phytohabitans sp. LJ34]|uniref:hypothetical protein n=1 Tax=Phytohabitans sp. LJ34 TaxID=3452217 RepID=UPI003F88EA96